MQKIPPFPPDLHDPDYGSFMNVDIFKVGENRWEFYDSWGVESDYTKYKFITEFEGTKEEAFQEAAEYISFPKIEPQQTQVPF